MPDQRWPFLSPCFGAPIRRQIPSALIALTLLAAAPHKRSHHHPLSQTALARARASVARDRATHEAALARARAELAQAQSHLVQLAEQQTQAASALRGVERDVLASSDQLAATDQAQQAADAALAHDEAQFSALVPLMLRLSRYPAETLLAVPAPPAQAMEGVLIARGLATSLNRQAADLRQARLRAAALRQKALAQQATLAAERARQSAADAALEQLLGSARDQLSAAEDAARREADAVATLAARAASLDAAIATIDRGRQDAQRKAEQHDQSPQSQAAALPPGPTLVQQKGRLVMPVAGRVLHPFGAPGAGGPATGITYATAPSAFVVSPCAGRIGFAAPFRSYGKLVILECSGGYDVVLAGLGQLDAPPGHAVRPGQPVGRMPDQQPALYVELRQRGQPVDPALFLNSKS